MHQVLAFSIYKNRFIILKNCSHYTFWGEKGISYLNAVYSLAASWGTTWVTPSLTAGAARTRPRGARRILQELSARAQDISVILRSKCGSDPWARVTKVPLSPIRGGLGLFTVTESIPRKIINSLSCLMCIDFCNYNGVGGKGAGGRKSTWLVFNLMHKLSGTEQLRRRGHAHPGCSQCSDVTCQMCRIPYHTLLWHDALHGAGWCSSLHSRQERCPGGRR